MRQLVVVSAVVFMERIVEVITNAIVDLFAGLVMLRGTVFGMDVDDFLLLLLFLILVVVFVVVVVVRVMWVDGVVSDFTSRCICDFTNSGRQRVLRVKMRAVYSLVRML
jgi:hypothetical protein